MKQKEINIADLDGEITAQNIPENSAMQTQPPDNPTGWHKAVDLCCDLADKHTHLSVSLRIASQQPAACGISDQSGKTVVIACHANPLAAVEQVVALMAAWINDRERGGRQRYFAGRLVAVAEWQQYKLIKAAEKAHPRRPDEDEIWSSGVFEQVWLCAAIHEVDAGAQVHEIIQALKASRRFVKLAAEEPESRPKPSSEQWLLLPGNRKVAPQEVQYGGTSQQEPNEIEAQE